MGRRLLDFARRDDGVVAVIFAVMAIPFIAMAGWAVDYLRIQHVREYLQVQVDGAALNAALDEREPDEQWEVVHTAVMAEIDRQYQGSWAQDVVVEHEWIHPDIDVKVTARADVPLAFIKLLPGIPDVQPIEVSAVAQISEPIRKYDINVLPLNYEAGDYNRIWAYCYWPNRWEHGELPKRTQMVPIADNGGPESNPNDYEKDPGAPALGEEIEDPELAEIYADALDDSIYGLDGREEGIWYVVDGQHESRRDYAYVAPLCQGDSYLSFRVENVRFARTSYHYWEEGDYYYHLGGPANGGGDGHYGRYNYYTDTVIDATTGLEDYALLHPNSAYGEADIMETVLCDTEAQCDPRETGNIIPSGTGRAEGTANERERADQACEAGKYMYYGFEDRPPGIPKGTNNWQYEGWTDADYDDIRMTISCPELIQYGDRNARLVG